MRYKFNQALHIGGKDFPRGNHEVPAKSEQDSNFLRYVGLGLIVDADPVRAGGVKSERERNEKLHNRLVEDSDAKKAKAHAAKEGKDEVKAEDSKEPDAAPKSPESEDDKKSDDKKHGKHGKSK